jgi:hypothetical protein
LIEAAEAFDRRVLSTDDAVCHCFRDAAVDIPDIRRALWGNPLGEFDRTLAGLGQGVPEQAEWGWPTHSSSA